MNACYQVVTYFEISAFTLRSKFVSSCFYDKVLGGQ
jgi:hypothetical protein